MYYDEHNPAHLGRLGDVHVCKVTGETMLDGAVSVLVKKGDPGTSTARESSIFLLDFTPFEKECFRTSDCTDENKIYRSAENELGDWMDKDGE